MFIAQNVKYVEALIYFRFKKIQLKSKTKIMFSTVCIHKL